jgi:hypothetical protein
MTIELARIAYDRPERHPPALAVTLAVGPDASTKRRSGASSRVPDALT